MVCDEVLTVVEARLVDGRCAVNADDAAIMRVRRTATRAFGVVNSMYVW
jgi:hypothetical protein